MLVLKDSKFVDSEDETLRYNKIEGSLRTVVWGNLDLELYIDDFLLGPVVVNITNEGFVMFTKIFDLLLSGVILDVYKGRERLMIAS